MITNSRSLTPANKPVVAAVFLFVFTLLIYTPTLITAEFVWDDTWFVVRNEAIRSWSAVPRYFTDVSTMAGERFMPLFRPIRNLTYLVDYSLFGLNPAGWHVHNIVWHAACVVLVFFLVRRISDRGDRAALVAALIFCVHPAVTESVAWVKSRDSLLSGTFALAACFIFLRARTHRVGWGWVAGVAALFALAIYSYLLALGLLIVMAAMIALLPGPEWRANRMPLAVLAVASLVIAILFIAHRFAFIGRMGQADYLVEGSAFWTMVTMIPAAATYLRLLVFPLQLNADYFNYPHYTSLASSAVIGSLALLIVLLGAALWAWWRGHPLPLLAVVWIVAFLLPVSNIVPTMQILAERFLYLPIVAVAMLAGHYWTRVLDALPKPKRPLWSAALIIVLAAFLIRTQARLLDWTDNYTLHESAWLADPENCRAIKNFGVSRFNRQEWAEAIALLEKHRAQCNADADVYRSLGFSYAHTGRPDMAIAALDEGIKRFPRVPLLIAIKALVASEAGNRDAALEAIYAFQSHESAGWDATFLIAVAWQNLGEWNEARRLYLSLLPDRPADPSLRLNLARVFVRLDDRAAARAQYAELLRLDPRHEEAARMMPMLGE